MQSKQVFGFSLKQRQPFCLNTGIDKWVMMTCSFSCNELSTIFFLIKTNFKNLNCIVFNVLNFNQRNGQLIYSI